jgi:glycosyltransferase involved in cell wall biosynthesis
MSTMPRSVLIVTPVWTRDGGVAAHVKESAAALAHHGLRVLVLAARCEPDETVPGITVYQNPQLFNRRASTSARLGEVMSLRPEIVHFHQFADPELLTAMRRTAPVLISAHEYVACTSGVYFFAPGEECTRAHGLGCVPNLMARGCAHTSQLRHPRHLPHSYRKATRTVDALNRCDLAISYSGAVDRHLAANGVTPRRVIPLFSTLVPKRGSGHADRRRVVFAGRVVALKGIDVLIRAAVSVDAEFVICGSGRGLDRVRRLAQRLGVEARVRFTGWLAPGQLADELANASVVVLPSLWPEPFGLVGIEALASGRPVIASSTGGIPDWLEDGVTGLSVPPGDELALVRALDELLADPDRQLAMGVAGSKMVATRFSRDRHLTALLEAYRSARSTWESQLRTRAADPDPSVQSVIAP